LLGLDHSTIVKWMSSGDDVTKSSEKIGDSPKTKLKGTVYNVWGFTIKRYRKELEAAGEIQPVTERLGADGRIIDTSKIGTASSDVVSSFDAWFNKHVVCGDMFDVLPKDPLKYEKEYNLPRGNFLIEVYPGKLSHRQTFPSCPGTTYISMGIFPGK